MDNNKPESVLTVTPPSVPSDTEPVVAEFSNNSKLTELRVWSSGSTVLHIGNVIADELNDIRRKHDEESKENLGPVGEEVTSSSSNESIGIARVINESFSILMYKNKIIAGISPIGGGILAIGIDEPSTQYVSSSDPTFEQLASYVHQNDNIMFSMTDIDTLQYVTSDSSFIRSVTEDDVNIFTLEEIPGDAKFFFDTNHFFYHGDLGR